MTAVKKAKKLGSESDGYTLK